MYTKEIMDQQNETEGVYCTLTVNTYPKSKNFNLTLDMQSL